MLEGVWGDISRDTGAVSHIFGMNERENTLAGESPSEYIKEGNVYMITFNKPPYVGKEMDYIAQAIAAEVVNS